LWLLLPVLQADDNLQGVDFLVLKLSLAFDKFLGGLTVNAYARDVSTKDVNPMVFRKGQRAGKRISLVGAVLLREGPRGRGASAVGEHSGFVFSLGLRG